MPKEETQTTRIYTADLPDLAEFIEQNGLRGSAEAIRCLLRMGKLVSVSALPHPDGAQVVPVIEVTK